MASEEERLRVLERLKHVEGRETTGAAAAEPTAARHGVAVTDAPDLTGGDPYVIERLISQALAALDEITRLLMHPPAEHNAESEEPSQESVADRSAIDDALEAVKRASTKDEVLSSGKRLLAAVATDVEAYVDIDAAARSMERATLEFVSLDGPQKPFSARFGHFARTSAGDAAWADAIGLPSEASQARARSEYFRFCAATATAVPLIGRKLDSVRRKLESLEEEWDAYGLAALRASHDIAERVVAKDTLARSSIVRCIERVARAVADATDRVGGLRCDSGEADDAIEGALRELHGKAKCGEYIAADLAKLTASIRSSLDKLASARGK